MAESHREEIAKLEALYASNPGGRVFVHLAEAYRKAGELELARGILSEGLARHTDSASGYVVLGRVLSDMGDAAEAETAFRRVLELDAGNLIALRGLGDLALESGRPTDALVLYRELLSRNPSNEEVRTLIGDVERRIEQEEEPSAAAEPAPEPSIATAQSEQPDEATATADRGDGGESPYDRESAGAGTASMLAAGEAEPHAAGDGPAAEAAYRPSAGLHESADEPGGPQLESEPVDAPVAPFSAAPGETADAAPPEPVLLDARTQTDDEETGHALPGDLGSFAGVADEAVTDPGEPITTDDEEAVAFATDDRELDVEELLQAASVEADDSGTAGDAEALDIETFDAANAPIDLPALELGVEQDLAADAGGSAAEFEGALDIGADLMPAAEFVGVFDEDDAGVAEEGAGPGDLDIELRFDDAAATGAGADAAAGAAWSDDEFPELSLAEEEPVVGSDADWHESEFASAAAAGQDPDGSDGSDGSDEAAEAGSTFTFWSGDDDVTAADEAAASVSDEAAREATDSADMAEAWRLPGRQEPQERGLETETMADLYRAQGFHDRAADVYRALLRRRPGDERLEARLRELEELKAGGRAAADRETDVDEPGDAWLRDAGSAWTGGQEADTSPYVWAEPGLAGQEEEGEPIGSYLAALTAWTPAGSGGATPAAADESVAQEPAADIELEPLEAEMPAGEAAAGADVGEAGGESWTDSVDYGYEPWTDTAEAAGPEAGQEAGAADPGLQPAATSGEAGPSAEAPAGTGTSGSGPSGRRDVVEAAFDEWYGEPAPQPQASSQDEDDEEDDEDLAMFRSWLQSLKK